VLATQLVTGKLGQGVLDSIVTVLDTVSLNVVPRDLSAIDRDCCLQLVSALGLVVGNMGMQSVRTMDLDDVNKYVKSLIALASVAVVLRVLWVADVVLQVQGLVRKQREDEDETGKNNDQIVDDAVQPVKLDGKTVVSYGVQVFSFIISHCAAFNITHINSTI
jgi:hypothetical protein